MNYDELPDFPSEYGRSIKTVETLLFIRGQSQVATLPKGAEGILWGRLDKVDPELYLASFEIFDDDVVISRDEFEFMDVVDGLRPLDEEDF